MYEITKNVLKTEFSKNFLVLKNVSVSYFFIFFKLEILVSEKIFKKFRDIFYSVSA